MMERKQPHAIPIDLVNQAITWLRNKLTRAGKTSRPTEFRMLPERPRGCLEDFVNAKRGDGIVASDEIENLQAIGLRTIRPDYPH